MKGTKMQKGITLIALIITIVVMLILSAVAIGVLSDSGIINRAKDAQTEYEIAEEQEKVILAANEAFLSGLGEITEEGLAESLDSNFGTGEYSIDSTNSEYFIVKITKSESKYTVYKNGKVEGPVGGEDDTLGVATVGIKVEKNSTINGKMYSSTNPIIPAGFIAINTGTSNWDAEDGPDVDEGLVIKDELGNEFVWVPVKEEISTTGYSISIYDVYDFCEPEVWPKDGLSEYMLRAGCETDYNDDGVVNSEDFKIQLTNEYKTMAESINKYNGFYVGRYETSRNGENPQSRRSTYASGSGEKIITAYNSSEENDWYGLYALNKKYSTSSVQGSMMWGVQLDKMVSWLGEEANTTITGRNKNRTCGTAEEDVINNIYDLYGNSSELTLCRAINGEDTNGREQGRLFYGGSYSRDKKLTTTSWGRAYIWDKNTVFGSRLVLSVV